MPANGHESDTSITLCNVAEVVLHHYSEEIWQGLKAAIGVITSPSLRGRDHCFVLVFEGPSGKGKSIIIRMVMPDRPSTENFLHRVDDFTPASFVSHAANRRRTQLADIDLLPRLRDKTMLTKELAPLFRSDEREMRHNFPTLTSVLDGNGYMTSSGVHGRRGYDGRYLFNWLGATTPIPDRTYKVMSQLGNRILFYEIAAEESSEEDLMTFARNYGTTDAVAECQRVVNNLFEAHFDNRPVESVDPGEIEIPEEIQRGIVRYSQLIAQGRVEVENDWGDGVEAGSPEGPHRIILLLQTLVRGLALADSRTVINVDDLATIRHIAFSSIPRKRRDLLRALLMTEGCLTSAEVENILGITRPTALKRMRELAATGIVVLVAGEQESSEPAQICLGDSWRWLLGDGRPL